MVASSPLRQVAAPAGAQDRSIIACMPTTEALFEQELKNFGSEVEQGTRCYFTLLVTNEVACHDKRVRAFLNRTPMFWNTCAGALQASAFLAVGRIFDLRSPHNLERLLGISESDPQIFSKAALKRRGQVVKTARPDDYLQSAYEPTPKDLLGLRLRVQKWRQIYNAKYRPLRNKYFAHREVSGEAETAALFGKGTNPELQRLFRFLGSLYQALFNLFYDGRKPVLRPARYSVARMRKKPVPAYYSGVGIQEHITREVAEFLICAARE